MALTLEASAAGVVEPHWQALVEEEALHLEAWVEEVELHSGAWVEGEEPRSEALVEAGAQHSSVAGAELPWRAAGAVEEHNLTAVGVEAARWSMAAGEAVERCPRVQGVLVAMPRAAAEAEQAAHC